MKKIGQVIIIVIAIVIVPEFLFAPPGGSWNPGNTNPTVPIGGGFLFMFIAAIFYGIKQYFKRDK